MTARYESQQFKNDTSLVLAQGVTSDPRIVDRFTDKTVQIDGTLSGATVTIQGRITPLPSWVALNTTVGLGLYEVSETVSELRLVVNGGDGSTAIVAAFAGFDTRVGH